MADSTGEITLTATNGQPVVVNLGMAFAREAGNFRVPFDEGMYQKARQEILDYAQRNGVRSININGVRGINVGPDAHDYNIPVYMGYMSGPLWLELARVSIEGVPGTRIVSSREDVYVIDRPEEISQALASGVTSLFNRQKYYDAVRETSRRTCAEWVKQAKIAMDRYAHRPVAQYAARFITSLTR